MATVNAVGNSLTGSTGSGAFVGETSPTIVTPRIAAIYDTSNLTQSMGFSAPASAVNYTISAGSAAGVAPGFQFTGTDSDVGGDFTTKGTGIFRFFNTLGSAVAPMLSVTGASTPVTYLDIAAGNTGVAPVISAVGTDSDIAITLNSKGTGGVAVKGSGTNDLAAAGYVGEFISSVIPLGSAVSFSTGTPTNLTSISLTAGDWDVYGNISFEFAGITGAAGIAGQVWISATSVTVPDASLYTRLNLSVTSNNTEQGIHAPFFRASLSSTTTIYLSGSMAFTGGTCVGCGGIFARRVR